MDRSDSVVAAAAPPAAAPVARRDSSSSSTVNGGASTRASTSSAAAAAAAASSSSRHASSSSTSASASSSAATHRSSTSSSSAGGGAPSGTSSSANANSHSLSRRNSGSDAASSSTVRDRDARDSTRDHHRDSGSSSRDSRHSSRDSRDRETSRDTRSSSQRGRSRESSSRDYRSSDRDRGSSSSSSSHHHHASSTHFGASGNPVVRLRERNNILVMHRTAMRRSNLTPAEIALRVHGLDAQYMKDTENPNISDKIGPPGVFPTNMNFPEEKFRVHSVRGVAYVNEPPRGFGNNWHLQYSFFTDKKFPVFDEIARAASVIDRIEKADPPEATAESVLAVPSQPPADPPFASFLIRNVRRIDDRISHQWMSELASGRKTIPELVQSYGVPFKQWRPVPNVAKCPLLDYVVRYRPGFAEATWFIRVNVIYVELNEIKRDCTVRHGDWFHNPRRFQRHALGWTEQLVDYLHSLVRLAAKTPKKVADAVDMKLVALKSMTVPPQSTVMSSASLQNHLHTEVGMAGGVPSQSANANQPSTMPPQLSSHEKWSYVLKLSEYQFKAGLLHRSRYFDGLLSLLQKALTPRGRSGFRPALLSLGVNEIMELVAVVQSLLPDLSLSADGVLLLVKTLLQHLRYLVPPGSKISQDPLPSPLQEELVVALCQMLRSILLNSHDVLVRLDENGPHLWPPFVFTNRFFDHHAYGPKEIEECLKRCRQLAEEVSGRIVRVQQLCSSTFTHAAARNEAQVILTLDRFHRVDANTELSRVYHEIFATLPVSPVESELPVDVAGVFLVCEWAITVHRPAEYRYLSTLSLLEMHTKALLEFGNEHGLLDCQASDHQLVLQGALQSFLQQYQLKAIGEVTQLVEFFCLLVRRRLFSVESFVDFAARVIEMTAHEAPTPAPVMSPNPNRIPSGAAATSATVVATGYNIECAPGRGYKASDIPLLTTAERLRLYLWQLPRGPCPLPTALPMIPEAMYDSELCLLRWLDVMDLRQEHLSYSKTLERAQTLSVYVFHTHGEVNDPNEPSNKDRVMREVEYQAKVSDLVSTVKTMCGHDKGRFTLWFLKNVYEEPSFFRFSELGSVEQIVRLVCLVLEVVDVLALLEVLIYFLRRSPAFLVKTVVLAMIERHEIAFCVTEQIPLLIQTFIDRFKGLEKLADDKAGNIARFFCKMFNAHSKKIGTPDLPFALIRAIAEAARKNNQEGNQKKELSLEAANPPPVRIPPPRDTMPPELKSALSRAFKALQARSFSDGSDGKLPGVNTPLASPDSQNSQSSATEPAFEAPLYASLVWQEVVAEATEASESKSRDGAIDFAAAAINMSMSSTMGATNANATRGRATPNYVFVLRAVLSEVMDKWMANITARTKNNYRRSMMTPQYVHRCVRLLREIAEQHPEGEEFQEKFSNTILMWLQKEVIPGFAGHETQRRVRNPFIKIETENGKEAFLLNQRGRLEKLQYGLKIFLVSLVIHKVLDLSQVLRLALFPLFPRLRRATRDPAPNLPHQLLAMALVFQLFSEPPPNVMIDPQRYVLFDEAMTKYHLRFMRSQVPAAFMFPLIHLLCQISYQMEENHTLRRRDERGNLASAALFNFTADPVVRDIIFHDTKEAREKHVLPVFNKKQWQWHTAVLMTHFFRPPNAPAEEAPNQVQLLKIDQIVDQMTVWALNRGGSIYLDLQICRLQQKATGSNKSSRGKVAKRKASGDSSTRLAKRGRHVHMNGSSGKPYRGSRDDDSAITGYLDGQSSGEEEVEIEAVTTGSATEVLASLIVTRTLRKSSRPTSSQTSTALCSVSPISMPHLFTRPSIAAEDNMPESLKASQGWKNLPASMHTLHIGEMTQVEKMGAVASYEAQEAALASLYASMICNISRRTMGSVIAKILQVLEDDAKSMRFEQHAGLKINGSTVVRLVSGVMCTQPGSAFLPRYMMSVATQLENLYEACASLDEKAASGGMDTDALRRLRRKLAVRLQLLTVIGLNKHITQTISYRNRMVKTLFYLLSTSTTNRGPGLSLFSWILDLVPHIRSSVLHEKHFELVASLDLPSDLKRRVWTLFPRPMNGAEAVFVRDAKSESFLPVDPWGLLEHAAPLPSDEVVNATQVVQPKRRRVFRCV